MSKFIEALARTPIGKPKPIMLEVSRIKDEHLSVELLEKLEVNFTSIYLPEVIHHAESLIDREVTFVGGVNSFSFIFDTVLPQRVINDWAKRIREAIQNVVAQAKEGHYTIHALDIVYFESQKRLTVCFRYSEKTSPQEELRRLVIDLLIKLGFFK